jgi:chromosome segregation protein
VLVGAADTVDSARERIETALASIQSELASVSVAVQGATDSWPSLVADLETELRQIEADLGADHLDAGVYVRAVEERTHLEQDVARAEARKRELAQAWAARKDLLQKLQMQRRTAFGIRRQAAATVNETLGGALRIEVTYLGDATSFATQLARQLQGSGVSSEAIKSIAETPGTDGVEISRVIADGAQEVLEHFGITGAQANRLTQWLTNSPNRLRLIETLAPDDAVSVALNIDGTYRDLGALSSGQKATAVLLLVFAQTGRPLVLDQPEDDLDNRFVYQDVVTLLRKEKGISDPTRRRQIIAATHNANIPVNGDAELVLSLAEERGKCTIRTRASIDASEVREEIRTVLEGGEQAFRRRAEKYGGFVI